MKFKYMEKYSERDKGSFLNVHAADKQRPIVVKMEGKAASSDSIATELLKSGEPNLVNALNEMIQQVWVCETLSES
jgi:hypothetical protein